MTNKVNVLLVEDDQWLGEHYTRVLEASGMRARIATNGPEAMDSIDEVLPSCIILDIFLAGPSGIALLHELRSHADLTAIPIIICSNSIELFDDTAASVYGIKELLNKATMEPADLIVAVKKVLL